MRVTHDSDDDGSPEANVDFKPALRTGKAPKVKNKVCEVCQRAFSKYDHLKRHLRTHNQDRPFVCPVCNKTFSRNDTMNRHLKVHKNGGSMMADASMGDDEDTSMTIGPSSALTQAEAAPPGYQTMQDPASVWGGSWAQNGSQLLSEPLILNPLPPSTRPAIPQPGLNAFATLALDLNGTSHHLSPSTHSLNHETPSTASLRPGSPIISPGHPQILSTPTIDFDWDPTSVAFFGSDLLDSMPHDMAPFGFEDVKWPSETYDDEGVMGVAFNDLIDPLMMPGSAHHYIERLVIEHRHTIDNIGDIWPSAVDVQPHDLIAPSGTVTPGARAAASTLEPLGACQPGFLDAAASAFFAATHSSRNVLHRPTFDHRRHAPLLRLATCAAGARYMHTQEGDAFANDVYDRMSMLLQHHWHDTSKYQLDFILCALLTQKHLLAVGKPHMQSRAFALAGLILASARRCGLFTRGNPTQFDIAPQDVPMHDPIALDLLWRKWATAQSVARLVGAIMHMETVISGLFPSDFVPPSIPLASLHIRVPTLSSDAFEAPDAISWAKIYLAHQPPHLLNVQELVMGFYAPDQPGLSPLPTAPRALDGWALMLLLDVIRGHGRARVIARLPTVTGPKLPDADTLWALERCRRLFVMASRHTAPSWLRETFEMRWHGTNAFCCIDNELIQVASGRDGGMRSREAFAQLGTHWTTLPLTRRALVHIGQIWRNFPRSQADELSPFPDFESLPFKGVLVLLAYSLCTANQADEGKPAFNLTSEVLMADLGPIGIDGTTPTPEDLAVAHPAVRFIHQGGPCCIVEGLPISTVIGRAAAIEFCAQHHALPRGLPGTAIGNAYAAILRSWTDIIRSSVTSP